MMYEARNVGAAKITASATYSICSVSTRILLPLRATRYTASPVRKYRFSLSIRRAGDPAVAFRPRQRTFFLRIARGEIMDARPRRRVFRQRAIIVAAGVVDVPVQRRRIETLLRKPIGHGHAIERRWFRAALHRNGELAGGAKLGDLLLKAAILRAIALASRHPPARCLPASGRG